MPRIRKSPALQMPTVGEDKAINAAARSDPDALPLTPSQLRQMVPLRLLRRQSLPVPQKVTVSVRYSPEVVAYFKAGGAGWQARMDSVLLDYVTKHAAPASVAEKDEGR